MSSLSHLLRERGGGKIVRMRNSEAINLIFFSALSTLALFWSLPSAPRARAILMGLSGIGLSVAMRVLPRLLSMYASSVIRDWMPVLLMAMAYWQSGCFFQEPNKKLQAIFDSWDARILRALRVPQLTSWTHSWFGSTLELAYLLCYPVVPLGVAALYLAGMRDRVDGYWLVVLLSAYPCYALLPFLQLDPPRVRLSPEETDTSGALRRLNLLIVGKVTHQATTVPSGHVASSTAIALVLLRDVPAIGLIFLVIAAGITVGCVSGKYHYAVDAVSALILAVIVFAIVTLQ